MKPAVIIFDWDGTVVDSTQTIAEAIRQSCRDLSLAVPSLEQAAYVIGLGLHDALRYVAPDLPEERVPELTARFRVHYLSRDQFLRPFDGMLSLFDTLRAADLPLAVATGKSRVGLERALDTTKTRHYFAATRCADESVPKPGPEMVLEICEELAIEPQQALVIGDTTHDLQMARAAGAHGLAVSYGAHPEHLLLQHSPKACVSSVGALQTWLDEHVL
jgi:phosphoglycolate phosphatase